MASTTFSLPEDFLSGPAPNLTREDINWVTEGMFRLQGSIAIVLDGVLSPEECDTLITAAESTTGGQWERAMVNVGGGQQAMSENIRKCGRIIWDNPELVQKLWARIEAAVPEVVVLDNQPDITGKGAVKRKELWKATRLNERMRFLKYTGGEYFRSAYLLPICKNLRRLTLNSTHGW